MSSSTSITPRETPHTKEWQLRIELAAAFQLAHRFGWTELVWNHISARVPGEPDHFLINPIGLRWDEITASKLIKIDNKGELLTGDGIAPKAGFVIHSAIHEARPDVNACMHTHTNDGIAVSALDQGLQSICHEALYFHDNIGYHEDVGAAMDIDQRTVLGEQLGNNAALVLRNHGLLTVGQSVGEAFTLMYWLQRACEIQMKVLASNLPWRAIPVEVCERFTRQKRNPRHPNEEFRPGVHEWPALLRLLNTESNAYRN